MEIKVTVEAAPELMTAIDTLTAALVELIGKREKTKPANSAKPADKPADQPAYTLETVAELERRVTEALTDQPAYTLETVRAKLAALSQSGKQKEVKAIIESFGVKKLTDIPAEHYPTVMALAAKLEAES